jgi:hypothetical protein
VVNAPAVTFEIKERIVAVSSLHRHSMYRVRMRSSNQKFTLKVTRRLPSSTNAADQNAQLSGSREILFSRNANLALRAD